MWRGIFWHKPWFFLNLTKCSGFWIDHLVYFCQTFKHSSIIFCLTSWPALWTLTFVSMYLTTFSLKWRQTSAVFHRASQCAAFVHLGPFPPRHYTEDFRWLSQRPEIFKWVSEWKQSACATVTVRPSDVEFFGTLKQTCYLSVASFSRPVHPGPLPEETLCVVAKQMQHPLKLQYFQLGDESCPLETFLWCQCKDDIYGFQGNLLDNSWYVMCFSVLFEFWVLWSFGFLLWRLLC